MATTILLFLLGVALLTVASDSIVKSAATIAQKIGLSRFVVGLLVVAFATSLPELVIALQAIADGKEPLALGIVVGNNIVNFGLVLSLAAISATLVVHWRALNGLLLGLIVCSVGIIGLGYDGQISRIDGIVLIAAFLAFTLWAFFRSESEGEYVHRAIAAVATSRRGLLFDLGRALLAIVFFVAGAHLVVNASPQLGQWLKLGPLALGLLPIAVCVALPEVVAAISAARRGHGDLVVGHVIGSSLMNTTLIVGILAIKGGLAIPASFLHFELPLAAIGACLMYPMLRGDMRISRFEGVILLLTFLVWVGVEVWMMWG